MVLIGYLPVAKLDNFTDKTCSLQGYKLFHHCMSLLLGLIVEAGKKGMASFALMDLSKRFSPYLQPMSPTFPNRA